MMTTKRKREESLITSRDPKGRQAVSIFEAAYNKCQLSDESAQQLNECGKELKEGLIRVITEILLSNQYADEEVESDYGYLSGYKPKSITEQANRLRELFPGIGYADEKLVEGRLPSNAEGWFAIPRWERIAPTYGEAVQKVFDLIKQTRNGAFYNYHKGQLGLQYLRQSQKSAKAFQKLGDEQKGYDILVVPAQFGFRHRGRSVRRAREVMSGSEFGLLAFAVGIMILTHPERLQRYDDLWIDCAGDEFIPDFDGQFGCAPIFDFFEHKVRFGAHGVGKAYAFYGSASAFLSQ